MQTRTPDRPAIDGTIPEEETPALRVRRRRRARYRHLRATVAGLLAMGMLAFPLLSVTRLRDLIPPIGFKLEGKWQYAARGTTFQQVVARFGLKPKDGSLLDAEGKVLRRRAYPGAIILNGEEETGDPVLTEADEISVVNGKDHVERLVRVVINIPGGKPGNPQFYLGTTPGRQVIQKGEISGKIVSSVFQPSGPTTTPLNVALTFDDGPWPNQTSRFLAVLKKFKVKATFFVVGYLAQRYPDLVRAEVKAGMTIGNHSWDHPNTPFRDFSAAKIRDEIARTRRYLASINVDTSVFRPPGGSYSDAVIREAGKLDERVVIWAVDPKDWWHGRTTDQIVQAVLSQVRPGSIILMHDGGGDRSATLAALPRIIRGIRRMGLGFLPLE
jgi:peptidoglycan/xylan/chitin deacetylase (PgdA/CDA1 family)